MTKEIDELKLKIKEASANAKTERERLEIRLAAADEKQAGEITSLEDKLTGLGGQISNISATLDTLAKKVDRPWYRQPIFWSGLLGVPGLILIGWLTKWVADEPGLINLIHRGFGTELAVTESFRSDRSELPQKVEEILAKRVDGTSTKFSEIFEDYIPTTKEGDFVKSGNMGSEIQTAVKQHWDILHLAMFEMGVIDPLAAASASSENTDDGFVPSFSSAFPLKKDQEFDVFIGIAADEIKFATLQQAIKESDPTKKAKLIEDSNTPSRRFANLSEILNVKVANLESDEYHFEDQGISTNAVGKDFRVYLAKGLKLDNRLYAEGFSFEVLEFEALKTNMKLRLVVMIRRSS